MANKQENSVVELNPVLVPYVCYSVAKGEFIATKIEEVESFIRNDSDGAYGPQPWFRGYQTGCLVCEPQMRLTYAHMTCIK